MTQLTSDALLKLSKGEKNPHKRVRLLAVSLFLECQNRAQVARQLKVAMRSVNNWVTRFLSEGISGLEDKPRRGKKPSLSDKQKLQLARFIAHRAKSENGGRLTGSDVQAYITEHFDVTYHHNHIYRLLKHLGFSWITSRSKHPKQKDGVQDAYKKVPCGNDHSHASPRKT